MFLSFKRRMLICVTAVILLCASAVSIAVAVTANTDAGKYTIVIDAGHGGMDGGVTGKVTGTKESDINLAIAKSLKHILKNRGYNVVMTRSNSDALASTGGRINKLKDMETRKNIVIKTKPDLVISIHCNFYPLSSVRGPQAFYAPSSEIGLAYAKIMQAYLNGMSGVKPRNTAKGDYYILQCSQYPSVLVECGFLSNAEDEKLLVSAAYQEKLAYAMFSAVNSIFSQDVKAAQ